MLCQNTLVSRQFHWHRVYGLKANATAFLMHTAHAFALQVLMALFLGCFRQKLANKPFTVVGDGEQKRDFIYVTDVANAFLATPLIPKVSVTTLAMRTHKASIGLLAWLAKTKWSIYQKPGEPDSTHANIDKALAELTDPDGIIRRWCQ